MKLIILNGPPGVGKSTVAEKLHADMPLSLLIVVDTWRKQISEWREHRRESQVLAYKMTLAAVDTYLLEGHDVIIDKAILNDDQTLDALVSVGEKHSADIYEIVITAEKEIVMDRAQKRGFNPNGLLTLEGVEHLWNLSQALKETRPNAVFIDASILSPEEVYKQVRGLIG
ncbi:MAG: AAA family ATPase [Patescibacteria group bacterium]